MEQDDKKCFEEMSQIINCVLNDRNIPHKIKVRTKNIYVIYKKLQKGYKMHNIYDLLFLKITVDDIANCYQTLEIIHSKYNSVNEKVKDYIYSPKTKMYRSLHTTMFEFVQKQIRTFDMDKIASFGLTAYWDISKGQARFIMQEYLRNKT